MLVLQGGLFSDGHGQVPRLGSLALGVLQGTFGCGPAFHPAGRETLSRYDLLVRVNQYEYSVLSAVGLALHCPPGNSVDSGDTVLKRGSRFPVSVMWLQGGVVEGKLC